VARRVPRGATEPFYSCHCRSQLLALGSVFRAGKFGRPSVNNADLKIEARNGNHVGWLGPVMVRIRRTPNTHAGRTRIRIVAAFAKLNNQGAGRSRFPGRAHPGEQAPSAWHAGFYPARAYILDLERELQAIDPSVACLTGALTRLLRISSHLTSSASPIQLALSSSATPTRSLLGYRRPSGN